MNKIPVIYILGSGSSGTTLLNLIMGTSPSIFAAGHLRNYRFLYSEEETRRCTCGKIIKECPLWSSVLGELRKAGYTNPEKREVKTSFFESLYESILANTNASIICDNSHSRSHLEELEKSIEFNVYILHIVRDGRGVKYSRREKSFLEKVKLLRWWSEYNCSLYKEFKNSENYELIYYENLVDDPVGTLNSILRRTANYFDIEIIFPDSIENGGNDLHMFSSNRMARKDNPLGDIYLRKNYLQQTNIIKWYFWSLIALRGLTYFDYPIGKQAVLDKFTNN